MDGMTVNLVKVFSATKARDREGLGTLVTAWLHANANVTVLKTIVTQSSDREYHCMSITLLAFRSA
jgi:hypothetical protein